jgi:TM2 domain-containing membrane protein YozV
MMQKNESIAAKLRERHREVFEQLHEKYDGKIIQYFGDGTLSIFSSTTNAVECAVELQRELKRDPQVPLRIGIHTGDVTFSKEEIYGDSVNIASRIESECVPGGVFISGKARDDIKNHPELRTRAIGQTPLKNIHQRIDLYAVTNNGLTVPDYKWETPQSIGQINPSATKTIRRKKKWVASLLAFFFGIFGIHRYYLDQRYLGILYTTLFFLGAFILPRFDELVAIPAILGFIDFIIFLTMSRDTFDKRYNKEAFDQAQQQKDIAHAKANDPKRLLNQQLEKHLDEAQTAYFNYDYDDSITALLKAAEIKYDDPETHFLLARCYSLTENTYKAINHLDIAVSFGLKDTNRIRTEGDLSFLRIQPEFQSFKKNNFRLSIKPPSPKTESQNLDESVPTDLLDQLAKLKIEREAGRLTNEEYRLKEKVLKSLFRKSDD